MLPNREDLRTSLTFCVSAKRGFGIPHVVYTAYVAVVERLWTLGYGDKQSSLTALRALPRKTKNPGCLYANLRRHQGAPHALVSRATQHAILALGRPYVTSLPMNYCKVRDVLRQDQRQQNLWSTDSSGNTRIDVSRYPLRLLFQFGCSALQKRSEEMHQHTSTPTPLLHAGPMV